MATYLSTAYNSVPTATASDGRPTTTGSSDNGVVRATFTLAIPTATALVAADVFKLAPIPLNYKVTGWFLSVPIIDNSAGVVMQIGDLTNSAGLYAAGLTTGRTASGGGAQTQFHRNGDAGTSVDVIASQLATYQAKIAGRVNKDSADDFLMKISTPPTSTQTGSAKTFYGWVDLVPNEMMDDQ